MDVNIDADTNEKKPGFRINMQISQSLIWNVIIILKKKKIKHLKDLK